MAVRPAVVVAAVTIAVVVAMTVAVIADTTAQRQVELLGGRGQQRLSRLVQDLSNNEEPSLDSWFLCFFCWSSLRTGIHGSLDQGPLETL
jgi:hypothetical protein